MQFQNPIVRQLVIYDNNGNPVVIIGPGPHIIAAGSDGEIDIDASTPTPSIYFWNTDRSDYARIQLYDATTTHAGIEMIAGQGASSKYPALTHIRAKVVLSDLPGSSVFGTVRMDTLNYIGGAFGIRDNQGDMALKDANGSDIAHIILVNQGAPNVNNPLIFIQGGDGTGINSPMMTVEPTLIAMKGPTLSDAGIEYRATTRAWTRQGSDGAWTDLILLSGWTMLGGYRRAQARINALGNVELRGTIRAGTIVDNTQIFTVPFTSQIPNANILLRPPIGPTGAGSAGSSRIYTPATGTFFCYGINAGGTTDLGLDGLSYTVS